MNVCVYIGGRANYSSIKNFMLECKHCEKINLQVIVGNSSVLDRFGNVAKLIEKDGFDISWYSYSAIEGGKNIHMAKSTAMAINDLASAFQHLKPDYVVVVGDRYEMMGPVIASSYMNIRIIHTMGGEVTGTIDESIRHAITKFSHIHFVASEDAMKRVIKLGEDPNYVFNVGCPRIDLVKHELDNKNSYEILSEYFDLERGTGKIFDPSLPFIMISHHPVTTEYELNRVYIENILKAVQELNVQTLLLWPNSDAGEDLISKGIRTFREHSANCDNWLSLHKNLPIDIYIHLMNTTKCLVGNSSSGVREGDYIGTPVVNIGSRQNTREQGKNVINTDTSIKQIYNAIKKQLNILNKKKGNIYGNGTASKNMVKILTEINKPSIQKSITY